MSTIAHEVVPRLVELLGPPRDLDSLWLKLYRDESYEMIMKELHMSAIDVDRDSLTGAPIGNAVRWDNTFVHELTHAFEYDEYDGPPGWVAEGMAEATRFFVAAALEKAGSARRMMDPRFPIHMALVDAYNRGGTSLSGGVGSYPNRANGEAVYRGMAAAIIIPCLAEIAAGRDTPHPVRRLCDAISYEIDGDNRHSMAHAADSVWNSPIDGLSPPSRWLSTRSALWSGEIPDGAWLAVLTEPPSTPVNPGSLQLFAYRTLGGHWFDRKIASGRMTFTAADSRQWESVSIGGVSAVPVLPLGAYRVDAEASTVWPEAPTVRGRNWIIVTSTGRPLLDSAEGTAVIFADSTGKPVDIPGVTVNGRVVERVPGGIVVAPYTASEGGAMLTLRAGDRILGSVTVPGRFSRTVVLNVDGSVSVPPVSWMPYRPRAGDSLTVFLRRGETRLDPESPSVTMALQESRDSVYSECSMRRVGGGEDLWVGRVRMPSGISTASLYFKSGWTDIGWRAWWWDRMEVRPLPADDCPISAADWDGGDLVLTFDDAVNDRLLVLQTLAANGVERWIDLQGRPVRVDGDAARLRFDLAGVVGRFRIVLRSGTGERVLLTLQAPGEPGRVRFSAGKPYPNPARGAIRWRVDAAAAMVATVRVYDLSGRLVAGPIDQQLQQGPQDVSWDRAALRDLPAGVYFLKLSADGQDAVRKVLVLPGVGGP